VIFLLLEAGVQYYIPKRRTYSKTSLLSSEMMLVVVLLKPMEKSFFIFAGIDVVQRVVANIITHVPYKEK